MPAAPLLLGIDTGVTVTKAVVFDLDGHEIARGETRVPQQSPRPRWVERDMDAAWQAAAGAVRASLAAGAIDPARIAAVGLSAHGDSLFPIDAAGGPVRPAILSLDSRAHAILDRWRAAGTLDRALPLTGQIPFVSTMPALLAWLREHEPASLARMRWALGCKDWLRFNLTGTVGGDVTEGSGWFADISTQATSPEALALFGLGDLGEKIPPLAGSLDLVGAVTPAAAAATGLRAGTPVAAGLHDVVASAIGAGCVHPGQLAMVAGSWSINLLIAERPAADPRWVCRAFAEPGRWFSAAWSPASASNLEWFVQELFAAEAEAARQRGGSPYAFVDEEAGAVWADPSEVVFLPFLYGSPHGDRASAALVGLRGWHTRGHVLRAILEGITFNHRVHVEALRGGFPIAEARLAGGGARSERWSQLFADALALPVVVTDAEEAGARGAALCAGVAAGSYPSLPAAVARATRVRRRHEPDPTRAEILQPAYDRYRAVVDALQPVWNGPD